MAQVAKLFDVREWTPEVACVPTVLCSVFDLPVQKVVDTLHSASISCDLAILATKSADYPIEVWIAAIKCLGWKPVKVSGDRRTPFERLSSIQEYMAANARQDEVRLVVSVRLRPQGDREDIGHLSGVRGRYWVDCKTRGLVEEFKTTPKELKEFRVKYTFRLTPIAE